MPDKLQVADSVANLISTRLLTISDNRVISLTVKRNSKAGKLKPGEKKITFIASPAEQDLIEEGLTKHNLRKASDIIRMALKHFAEREQLELRAS